MNRFRRSGERKSIRLKGWDYRTPAWYFITICTKDRNHSLGEIHNGIVGLSEIGLIAHHYWAAIPDHFDHIKLDTFVIMPNHVHGLIGIMERPISGNKLSREFGENPEGTRHGVSLQDMSHKFGNPKSGSISTIVNHYKGSVTRRSRLINNYEFAWQSRFHDHIIRNEKALNKIQDYIINNPLGWENDQFY
jgi:REP element-mobilizing transposase RayT